MPSQLRAATAMGRRPLCHLIGAALVACYLVAGAAGHGYMYDPPARNVVAQRAGTFYDQQSGNGLGSPTGPNPFGDPFQGTSSNFAGLPLRPQVTYTQGQVVSLKVRFTANHGGRFAFRICPHSTGPWTQDCFNQPGNALTRVDNNERNTWIMDQSMDFNTNYRLPAGITCPGGCVLQWEYIAMQSCAEPGCNPTFCGGYAQGRNVAWNSNPGFCDATRRPEVFFNGADIIIVPSGTPVTPPPTTPVTPPPTTPVTPPPTTPTPGTPSTCPTAPGTARAACICQGRAPGYYADVLNRCVGASWCYVGGSVYITCPTGLMWDSRANTCNFPAQVTCA